MTYHFSEWPSYASPYEALCAETNTWGGDRLDIAKQRLQALDGELPPAIEDIAIGIIDGNSESPETFSMLNIYDAQNRDPEKTGTLLYVNYTGDDQPHNTHDLLDVIHEQREHTDVPTAIAIVGYESGARRLDEIREGASDITVAHALRHEITHPIVSVSNDADMIDASPDYLENMTKNEHVGSPYIWGSEVAFDAPGGADLTLNKAVAHLMQNRAMLKELIGKQILYGGSMATTLDNYAIAGGWTSRHGESLPHGRGEPQLLILNMWERATGREGSIEDMKPVYEQCARFVGGVAVMSPRRELLALWRDLGDPGKIAADLDTKPDNPYRRLTNEQLAAIAGSVSVEDPLLKQHLDAVDKLFIDLLPPELQDNARDHQRTARESLGLPPE
jgi:hypothetical protein